MVKASVCMITYNHEKYIAQAIESVIMQKTDFDYELVIGEDCSTDRTRDICKSYENKYPEKIRLFLHERNLGVVQNLISTFRACNGKYIALLESDDYWINPLKLQKQIDFLEANQGYGLVHSDFDFWDERKGRFIKSYNNKNKRKIPQGNIYEELLRENYIHTLTVCLKKELIVDFIADKLEFVSKNAICDLALWLEIARKSKVAYFNEPLATYRRLVNSASHIIDSQRTIEFFNSVYDIRNYFINKHGCSDDTKKEVLKNYHLRFLKIYFEQGNSSKANLCYKHLKENHKMNRLNIYIMYVFGSYNKMFQVLAKIFLRLWNLYHIIGKSGKKDNGIKTIDLPPSYQSR